MTVDVELMRRVALVESGASGVNAMRFEAAIYTSWAWDGAFQTAMHCNHCSIDTAKAICATSYGKFQILGYNLYLDGYTGPIANFIGSETDQDKWFDEFLNKRGINFTWSDLIESEIKARSFVVHYNGPGGWPSYWELLKGVK